MPQKRKLIFDTDPGVDDAMALQFLLAAPQLELIGLTTVFGNGPVDLTTTNALRLLDLAGRTDIPVARGADKPLRVPFEGGALHVHGDDAQGNTFAPPSQHTAISLSAAEFLVQQIKAQPGELTIVAVGPLTNLALALQLDPTIANDVVDVVIMGGNAFCSGNITPAAEANVWSDPDAADLVFGANWRVTMIGLDVTHRVNLTGATIAELAKLPGAFNQYVAATIPFYQAFYERVNNIDGLYVHDSTAIAYLLAPELFDCKQYPVRVDTSAGISRGKTWPSLGESDLEEGEALLPWKNRPLVNIAVGVRGEGVVQLMMDTLRPHPRPLPVMKG
ncbi:nucleoside hydrolase [Spirosoma montaniterrae]|uniref:Inosine/uridine-preferring nucleoside hydrolase domain-containing protein n=1 Tax=Spirosoma montaniterrae TaxID=1178516 RepID=A0A1P9WTT0_9BACT|nr:nucleoside hydrolase [Spirosoma montaniterrae]AQG78733.1 hypothetical protein AWR27_04930 [Spirosoma montaniterrae]